MNAQLEHELQNTITTQPAHSKASTVSQSTSNSLEDLSQQIEAFSNDSPSVAFDIDAVTKKRTTRLFQPLRFAMGLILTTTGVSLILWTAIQVLDVHYFGGRFALVLVAVVVMTGVMLLGAGFGLMATASAGFDESEFDRLIRSGNISAEELQVGNSTDCAGIRQPVKSSAA